MNNLIGDAAEAFQLANTILDMRRAVARYPFMMDRDFLQLIEMAIIQQVPAHLKSAFQQRLVLLKQIIAEQKGNN